MKLEKCPICSTRMREQDGRMICQNCGYYQIIDKDASAPIPAQPLPQRQEESPSGPPGSPYGQNQSNTWYAQQDVTVSASSRNNKISAASIVGWITFAVMFLIMIGIALFQFFDKEEMVSAPTTPQWQEEFDPEELTADAHLPASESFQALVAQVFGKDFSAITPADLEQITELEFYYDEDNRKCVSCYLEDGTSFDFFLNEALDMDWADLSCFKGVSWLSLEYGYLNPGDLMGMESLTSIASDMTLAELYEAVPHPENIDYIQIESAIFMDSCDGIEKFPNLTYFATDCMDLQDISALTALPDLEGLALTDCDRLTDFSPLYEMTGLEILSIQSSSLKDIGFVKNMPYLDHLSIADADELMSIEALEACSGTLTELYLKDTWKLSDFSVIEKLTNLTDLELTLSYDHQLPSFENLKNLTYLSLYGADDLSPIAQAKELLYLSLDNCDCEDLSFMKELPNLLYLDLQDMSGYYVSLDPVLELPNLLGLDISRSVVYADAAKLLSIPTLEEFYMEECSIGFDMDHVPVNEALTVLDMNEVTLYQLSDGYGWLQEQETLSLSDHTGLFANFPNLEQLYLKGNELTDLSFITECGLTNLRTLDITDNYIVDLSPLADLAQLEIVACEDNPIADTAGLDDLLVR